MGRERPCDAGAAGSGGQGRREVDRLCQRGQPDWRRSRLAAGSAKWRFAARGSGIRRSPAGQPPRPLLERGKGGGETAPHMRYDRHDLTAELPAKARRRRNEETPGTIDLAQASVRTAMTQLKHKWSPAHGEGQNKQTC